MKYSNSSALSIIKRSSIVLEPIPEMNKKVKGKPPKPLPIAAAIPLIVKEI